MCCTTPAPLEQNSGTKSSRLAKLEQQTHNPTSRRRRRVTFNKFASTTCVASLKTLPIEYQDQIWYRTSDIDEFRSKARDLCREIRQSPSSHEEESTRGLEFRTNAERQTRKDLTVKCVLKVQRRSSNPRTLAHIYRKCSAWTIVAAARVGRSDFFSAYDLAATCDTTVPQMANYPLPFRSKSEKKRASCEISSPSSDSVRRVRSRTAEAI